MRDGNFPARPDPFLFPPETTFRFYALVAALFGALTFVWAWFYLSLPTTRSVRLPAFATCVQSASSDWDSAQDCLNEFNLRQGLFVAACLAATALTVLLLHLLRPFFVIARQRLRPLDETADPDALPPFRAALDALVAQAGVRPPPRVLVRPRAMTEAFTFGSWLRRYLSLDSGLVGEFFTDRAAFDAKIRHELAHFRNRDISKAELTTISWWLFAAIVPLLLLYSFLQQGLSGRSLAMLASQGWRFALVVGVVYLARNAVIRAREFDADARAFVWDGPRGALIGALSAKAALEAGVRPWWWRLSGILRLHPSADERVASLRRPGSLLRAGSLILPAVIGVAYGIGEPPGTFVLTFFTQGHGFADLGGTIVASLFLLPLAGWAGVAIWRDASGSLRRGVPELFAVALGLAAAVGIMTGFNLSFMAFLGDVGNPSPALPVLVLTLFFLWVRAGAYWWQSSELGRRLAVPACWISLAIGCFVLIAMWSKLSSLDTLYNAMAEAFTKEFSSLDLAWTFFRTMIVSPVTLLFFVVLWLFVAAPRWLGLVPQDRRRVLRRRKFKVIVGTLVFAAILVAGRFYLQFSVEAGLRGSDEFKVWFLYFWLLTGALLQGGLAFILTVRPPVATVAEACFCALVAGLLMGMVMLAVNVAFGGGLGMGFVVNTLCQFASGGVFTALPMAALGSSIRFVATGFRPLPVAAAAARQTPNGDFGHDAARL